MSTIHRFVSPIILLLWVVGVSRVLLTRSPCYTQWMVSQRGRTNRR